MKTFFILSILVSSALFSANVPAAQPSINKIEPPNWWIDHSINPVRILIEGSNLQNAKILSANPDLKVSNVREGFDGKYLFLDLEISPKAKPGNYELRLSGEDGSSDFNFTLSPPLRNSSQPATISNSDVIYLIMTDRFADGDTANNFQADRANPRAWHGGDFKGIVKNLPYLKELGVTAIWLTPWYDNPDEANRCDQPWCPYTNYHGYHPIDFYGVENHFGSLDDLKEMIRECQKAGIKVIQDQVSNHVGVQHRWVKSPPLASWFSPFSQNSFNDSALLSPNAGKTERENVLHGWFNEFLPDLNQDEPEVSRYEIQNTLWWIGMTGINGIRQDTIQYMPRKFISDWSSAIEKQFPGFYVVGEVFEEDPVHTAFFQGGKKGWDGIDTHLPSVFDFKLWRTSQEVFTGKKPASSLRDVLKYDGLYPDVNRVTVFTNNHDTDRFMSLPAADKDGAKLHMAFILASRGIPQLYYGEELLMTGGHDPDNRKDFPLEKANKSGRTADETEMFEWTRDWIATRRQNPALRVGQTIDVYYDENIYAFRRKTGENDLLLIFNNGTNEKSVFFEKNKLGEENQICYENGLVKLAGAESAVKGRIEDLPINGVKCWSFTDGKVKLSIRPRSVVILRKWADKLAPAAR